MDSYISFSFSSFYFFLNFSTLTSLTILLIFKLIFYNEDDLNSKIVDFSSIFCYKIILDFIKRPKSIFIDKLWTLTIILGPWIQLISVIIYERKQGLIKCTSISLFWRKFYSVWFILYFTLIFFSFAEILLQIYYSFSDS